MLGRKIKAGYGLERTVGKSEAGGTLARIVTTLTRPLGEANF
jgi:hypothetical protein